MRRYLIKISAFIWFGFKALFAELSLMIRFWAKKAGLALSIGWGIVTLLFLIFSLMGDPASMVAGQRTDEETLASIRKELGIDLPLWRQYLSYLQDLSPLDVLSAEKQNDDGYQFLPLLPVGDGYLMVLKAPYLRRSFQTRRPVSEMYFEKLPGTLALSLAALFFAATVGVAFGVWAGYRQQSLLSRLFVGFSLLGVSMPSFLAAVLFVWVFAIQLYPITGLNISGYFVNENIFDDGFTYEWKNLLLPAITLGIRPLSVFFQLTRDGMLQTLRQDYVRTARAKGLNETAVVFKHALRNALNPVVTSMTGWLASMLAGAFFIEYLFDWQGVGKLTIDALNTNDYPLLLGCCLATGLLFAVINFLTDFLYAWIDPRVKA